MFQQEHMTRICSRISGFLAVILFSFSSLTGSQLSFNIRDKVRKGSMSWDRPHAKILPILVAALVPRQDRAPGQAGCFHKGAGQVSAPGLGPQSSWRRQNKEQMGFAPGFQQDRVGV